MLFSRMMDGFEKRGLGIGRFFIVYQMIVFSGCAGLECHGFREEWR